MLLELAPNAVVSITKENLVNIATSHHFSLDLLSKIPKRVFEIERIIKSDGQFVFKKSEIESSIHNFIYLSSSIKSTASDRNYHGFLRVALSAQLYLYYISKIKVTLFAPQFDPRLSNTIGLFYVVATVMSFMTVYLILHQTNMLRYRYTLIAIFSLGVAVTILMSTWGISILDRMFGIGSGSILITWLAAIPALILFFIPAVYAIDNRIGEK